MKLSDFFIFLMVNAFKHPDFPDAFVVFIGWIIRRNQEIFVEYIEYDLWRASGILSIE